MKFNRMMLMMLIAVQIGCSKAGKNVEVVVVTPTQITGITRIFMHVPYDFTFFVKRGQVLSRLRISAPVNAITILEDLRSDESLRIEYSCSNHNGFGRTAYQCKNVPYFFSYWRVSASHLTIHTHSSKAINGTGWDHGKSGRGQTIVLE